MKRKEIHPSVTMQRVMDATQLEMTSLDNPGICLACGADADGCESDARKYECEVCGAHEVYGAAEILLMGAHHP
jgi:predicted amidophosphoribosyltransferase